jgi:hypothetical protein
MKKTALYTVIILVALCLCLFFFQRKRHGETRISIKQNETSYAFTASYDPGLTANVNRYLDTCASRLRGGQTNIRLRTFEGELEIKADKRLNSSASIKQVDHMCRGIAGLINPN